MDSHVGYNDIGDADDLQHGDHDNVETGLDSGLAAGRRAACDLCRSKKVGCDREDPCSSCVRGQVKCTYSSPVNPRPKRQRVLISTQYEKKIDRIEERLSQVVHLLQGLSHGPPQSTFVEGLQGSKAGEEPSDSREKLSVPAINTKHSTTPAASSTHSFKTGSATTPNTATDEAEDTFEGDTSMAVHTGFASEFIQQAVRITPLCPMLSGEIGDTLNALKQIVSAQSRPASNQKLFPHARPKPPGDGDIDRVLPSTQLAMSSLKLARDRPEVEALWLSGFMTVEHFTELAISVYFSPDSSIAEYITVCIGFYWLFNVLLAIEIERERSEDDAYRHDLETQRQICLESIDTTLSQLPFHLPTDLAHAVALGFASEYALEKSKPSLAWHFVTTSSMMCQNLGFHRLSSMQNDKPSVRQRKIRVFWGIYITEKSLALRLGRPSAIHDYDITVPMPDENNEASDDVWRDALACWARVGSVQGRVYEQLYSPTALRHRDDVRAARAYALSNEMKLLMNSASEIPYDWTRVTNDDGDRSLAEESAGFLMETSRMVMFSTLALIYRAVPVPQDSPSAFAKDCVEAARSALSLHRKMTRAIHNNFVLMGIWVQWAMLYTPFVPFIVIFCRVIETSDRDDLSLLDTFTKSLASTGNHTRMTNLFQVLYNVALKYIEIKSSSEQEQQRAEFDSYIQALGFKGLGQEATSVGGYNNTSYHQQTQAMGVSTESATMMGGNNNLGGGVGSGGPMDGIGTTTTTTTGAEMMPQQGAMLAEWFSSSHHMMGLLEQDHVFDFEM